MKHRTLILSLCLAVTLGINAAAKSRLAGRVSYNQIRPLVGVNVWIEGSYEGTTTDAEGQFSFDTELTGSQRVIAKLSGFTDVAVSVVILTNATQEVNLTFTEKAYQLEGVTIKSRVFETSDVNKVTTLDPVEIQTTSTNANIVSALKTLPGAQQIGESGDLFVRGGTGNETRTFIDGMWVSSFNQSSLPGIASRSRFSPNLFKGTYFTTGGYSALYGQALSSTLILETEDVPERSTLDLTLSPFWGGADWQKVSASHRSAVGVNVNYNNFKPIFSLQKSTVDFTKAPEMADISLTYRHKLGDKGTLKFFTLLGGSDTGIQKNDLDYDNVQDRIRLKNGNLFSLLTYRQKFGSTWRLDMGLSASLNQDRIAINAFGADQKMVFDSTNQQRTSVMQGRAVLSRYVFGKSKLYIGSEYQRLDYQLTDRKFRRLTDNYTAVFTELETYLTRQLSLRSGLRYEYASVLDRANLAPRLSLGYSFENNGLLSASYGIFYQKPENSYLLLNPTLRYYQATHYMIGYQKMDNYYQFRAELYYKKYTDLLKINSANTDNLSSAGYGYATGLDVFWRDKKTFTKQQLQYWISYSHIDTKRNYLDYPFAVQPGFAANHTVSLTLKKFLPKLNTFAGATYTYASGRPYRNPAQPAAGFMQDRTIDYNNLGLTVAYLPKKLLSTVVVTVSNVMGNQQIFGYNYSNTVLTRREAITPVNNPFVFIGFFKNIGIDRTDRIIDSKL